MKVIHFTHCLNLPSILARGLAPGLARGAKRVWFARPGPAAEWAINHVCETHEWQRYMLVACFYDLPKGRLCRSGRPGVLWTPYDVPVAPESLARLDRVRTKSRLIPWSKPRS